MQNSVDMSLEARLTCPWWGLCLSHQCLACVQAIRARRIRAARAQDLDRLLPEKEPSLAKIQELEHMFDIELERHEWEQLAWYLS